MRALPITVPTVATLAAAAALLAACAGAPPSAPPAPPDAPTCPSTAEVADTARRWVALEALPIRSAPMTLEGAACAQRKLVAALEPSQGKVVGWKAGLTNVAVQQRFGLSSPLQGTLLAKMILPSGSTVPAKFGFRPFAEPDLVVEIGSAAVNQATSPEQMLAAVRSIRPFIELPDVLVEDPSKITAPVLLANNVGARLGVLGDPIPVRADAAFAESLKSMRVRSTDAGGKELGAAPGAAILGHPLNAMSWLVAELKKQGIVLKPGDLLSLGAFGNLPVAAGNTLTVTYEGLPGNPAVSVTFK
jgi:2-keto-4-pentenoate hydratase